MAKLIKENNKEVLQSAAKRLSDIEKKRAAALKFNTLFNITPEQLNSFQEESEEEKKQKDPIVNNISSINEIRKKNEANYQKSLKIAEKQAEQRNAYMHNIGGVLQNESSAKSLHDNAYDIFSQPLTTNEEKKLANQIYKEYHSGDKFSGLGRFYDNVKNGLIDDYNINLFTASNNWTKDQKEEIKEHYKKAKRQKAQELKEYGEKIKEDIDNNAKISFADKIAAKRFVDKANDRLNASYKGEGTAVGNAIEGIWKTISDRDFWTVGITELSRNNKVKNATERYNNIYQK